MLRPAIALAAVLLVTIPAAAREAPAVVVTFKAGSDEVTPAGRAQLEAFARQFKTLTGKSVSVEGHATLAESDENSASFAVGFSQRRAANVREVLWRAGVPIGDTTTRAFGSTRPLPGIAPGDRRNQRVEVLVTDGAGW